MLRRCSILIMYLTIYVRMLDTVVWEKLVAGNIHEIKICGKIFLS